MNLLILTARPELWANRRLAEAVNAAGARAIVVDALALIAGTGPPPWIVGPRGSLLEPRPAAVVTRVGNWRPETVLGLLETAVAAGVPTPNPPPSIRLARDHWRTVRTLAAAGIPVPETVIGADPERLAAGAVRALGLPVVVKQRRSRMGVGVIRCEGRDHLEAVLDSLWRVGDEICVQAWVEARGASDRLLVVGDRVVAAARMTAAAGEWRSNAARGGRVEPLDPTPADAALAVAAARAAGLRHAAVDVLRGADGPLVCEVNPTPGFRALERATGIDIAAVLVADALGPRRA